MTYPTGRHNRLFFRVRVAVLATVLLAASAYAWRDLRRRRSRNDWDGILEVGIVVLHTTGPLDPAAVPALRERTPLLERKLAAELRRYRPDAPRPFHFNVHRAVEASEGLPHAGDGWLGAVRFAAELWWYLRGVDQRAGLDPSREDATIYVVARPVASEARAAVEGFAQQGGRVAVVDVELDGSMADFTLMVAAHELFHTLGASDKYDAMGRALVPAGLAEPDRIPLYPQRYVEVMARDVPVSATEDRAPSSLEELTVGAWTAREIGWTP